MEHGDDAGDGAGDDDDGDFPPLRSSGAAGSDPLRRELGVSPPPPPRMDLGKLGRNFLGETMTC